MTLTERQISKLRELAEAEERHTLMARGLIDRGQDDYFAEQRIRADIHRLEDERRRSGRTDVIESIDRELQRLKERRARIVDANARRQREASEHVALANSAGETIDAVLAHVGSSRGELGLDFFRNDRSR